MTVLLVDDNEQLLSVLCRFIKSQSWEVIAASFGEDAISILGSRADLELVVTDAVMPGQIQGLHVAQRAKVLNPKIPVLMISGYVEAEEVYREGPKVVDAFLSKPFSLAEFYGCLAALLTAPAGNRQVG